MKRLIFGDGEITTRMQFETWLCRLEFKPQDFWIGAFWKTIGNSFEIWVCLFPCLPIHFTFLWHDPEQ